MCHLSSQSNDRLHTSLLVHKFYEIPSENDVSDRLLASGVMNLLLSAVSVARPVLISLDKSKGFLDKYNDPQDMPG